MGLVERIKTFFSGAEGSYRGPAVGWSHWDNPFPIPFGWFQVAFPDDLAPGDVTALRYWGRDLVLWRDTDGGFHLQDAYCPHLGAHIGIGGTVDGDQVVCPFHGWRYDGDGTFEGERG